MDSSCTTIAMKNSRPWVRKGWNDWQSFMLDTGLHNADVIALYDMNDVVNSLSSDEAASVGVECEHDADYGILNCICSFGTNPEHVSNMFDCTRPYAPFLAEMDAVILTTTRSSRSDSVSITTLPNTPSTCRVIHGDKGQAAALLGKPVVLFDDKEANIAQVCAAVCPSSGFVVRRGKKNTGMFRVDIQSPRILSNGRPLFGRFNLPYTKTMNRSEF